MDMQKLMDYYNALPGFNRHNGIRLTELSPGGCTVEAKLTPDAMNPMGAAHGGLIYSLADCAAGYACVSRGRLGVTLSAAGNYLKAGQGDLLRATAAEQHYGGHTAVYLVEITDQQGDLVATFTVTYFLTEKTLKSLGL